MTKPTTHDWKRNRDMWERVLERQTGEGIAAWNRRLRGKRFSDERAMRAWLTEQGVTGYGRSLLVMERFGYPGFFLTSADKLVDDQYADRPHLRPIYDAIIKAASSLDDVVIQTRKTFVALVTPRRTFARIVPSTKTRIDLGLRLEGRKPGGRLVRSKIHETMPVQVSLESAKDVDKELRALLREAWEENS
jgi:hypothetical protein